MPTKPDSIKARAARLLKSFTDPTDPDAINLMSVYVPDQSYSIDDGDDGDLDRSTKPDFVQKELNGWH